MNVQPAAHPTDETLVAYGLGKIDDAGAEAVVRHLEACPACVARVAEMSAGSFVERLRAAGGRDRTPDPPGTLSPLPPPPKKAVPPELAGHPHYDNVRPLGQGGMGVVYLATNRLMGRPEVLKVVGKELIARPGAAERFLREIRSAARLQHPNIVAAYSALEVGDLLVFAMEYVPGDDLAKVVKSHGPLAVANACYYAYQVAQGLQHAHEKGMVHRDIKPGNLVLHKDGARHVVKVLDFGLAKAVHDAGAGAIDGELTGEGKMLGTPDYIAPEQILDAAKADTRADVYSLGCTLYYLLAGRPPFTGATLYALLTAHQTGHAVALNLVRPEVPAEVAAVVAKMMAKEPGKRHQTPGEVAKALAPFIKPGSKPAAPPSEASQAHSATARPKSTAAVTLPPVPPAVLPVAKPVAKPVVEAELWEALPEPAAPAAKKSKPRSRAKPVRRPPWLWPAVAGGVLFAGLLAAWAGGVFKVKTAHGTIVVEGAPDGSVVTVEGAKVTVAADGETLTVSEVPADGKGHRLRVTKGGVELFAQDVTVTVGGAPVRLRYEPPVPQKAQANEPLALEGSEWAGTADIIEADGSTKTLGVTLTVFVRNGPAFKWRSRASNGGSVIVAGSIDATTGRIIRQYSQQVLPNPGPARTEGTLSGEVRRDSMTYTWSIPSGASGLVSLKRLTDNGEKFDLTGRWQVRHQPRNWTGTLTILGDGKLTCHNGDAGTYTRDGGLIRLRYPTDRDAEEWLVIHPDQPDRLLGGFERDGVRQTATLTRVSEPPVPVGGFVPLFNGKDLAGWKTHPTQPGNWRVVDGVLTGSGPETSHLFSERGDFTDFRLAVEARINATGNSGVYLRGPPGPAWPADAPKFPGGYEVEIGSARYLNKTGGLNQQGVGNVVTVRDLKLPDGEWFKLDISAVGGRITTAVNGRPTADFTDEKSAFPRGHLALQQFTADTVIEFRKIDVQEVAPEAAGTAGKPEEPKVLHLWQSATRGKPLGKGKLRLIDGGTIRNGSGQLMSGTWKMAAGRKTLVIRWPVAAAPGGYWVDTFSSTDGVDFQGRNNNTPPVLFIGRLSEP